MSSSAQSYLEPFSTLGMTGISNTGAHYINDASLVIPAGNQIIIQSLDTGERTFLFQDKRENLSGRNTSLTSFAVSSDGTLLALGSLRHNDIPIISVFTVPKGIIHMSLSYQKSNSVFYSSFHRSMKLLLVAVAYPRKSSLYIYNTQTKTEVKTIKISHQFQSAIFSPHNNDSTIILFSQQNLTYIGKNNDTVSKIDIPNYSRFSGFVFSQNEPNICIASSGRDLLFFQNMVLKHTTTISEESPIVYLQSFNHGLIATTENSRIVLFQHVPGLKDISRIYQQGPVISYGIKHPIIWASFSQSGHQMVCDVDNRQLLLVNIRELESNTENAIVNPNIVSHKGPVAAISSCAYKPMLVSCGSEDRTVIVWDYSRQCSVLSSEFNENLTDVSFHPSGDLVAVASSDKLYLLAATVDSLVGRAQWPLFNCLSIQFSNGGHFLVAASHIITFINPYTQEIIATLRGHTGLIQSLAWSQDDKRLVSSGSDGMVIEWNAVTQEKSWDKVINKCDFVSSVITDRGTVISCASTDLVYHLYNERYQSRKSEDSIGFSAVIFASPSSLVIGDILGGLQIVPFPFIVPQSCQSDFEHVPQLEYSDGHENSTSTPQAIPFLINQQLFSHCGRVTRLCSSLDSRVLFTSSSDSSICIFNILSLTQTYAESKIPILRCDIPRQQFFLVSQSRFDELQHGIEKQKRDIQKQRYIYESETIDALKSHQKNIDELTKQHKEKKEKLNNQLSALRAAMDDSTIKAALIYQNMENSHFNEAKALTNLYEQKLALERSKCDSLTKEVEDLKCSYEERHYLLEQQFKASLEELGNKISSIQNQLTNDLDNTKRQVQETEEDTKSKMIELEVEFEKDKMALKLEHHRRKLELKNLMKELQDKHHELSEEIEKQKQILGEKKKILEEKKEERIALDKELKSKEHTLECKKSELNDRDETLKRQAARLDTLLGDNVKLEKSKATMIHNLGEKSQELQPKIEEITRLRSELNGTSEEIRTIKRIAKANSRTMQDKMLQIGVLKKKLVEAQTELSKKRRVIQIFNEDLKEGVSRSSFEEQLSVLKELHDKYVAVHNLEENIKDANDTINEHTRQRKHLQESVMLLQKSVKQQQKTAMKHLEGKSSENSQLLSDLNMLQKENRTLSKRLDLVRSDLDMVKTNLKRVKQATQEQRIKQQKLSQSSLGPQTRVTGDWVKENARTGATSGVSVIDSRGKYLHSGKG